MPSRTKGSSPNTEGMSSRAPAGICWTFTEKEVISYFLKLNFYEVARHRDPHHRPVGHCGGGGRLLPEGGQLEQVPVRQLELRRRVVDLQSQRLRAGPCDAAFETRLYRRPLLHHHDPVP